MQRIFIWGLAGSNPAFTGVDFSPLSSGESLDKNLINNFFISLNWISANVVESNIPEIELDKTSSPRATRQCCFRLGSLTGSRALVFGN